MIYIFKRNKKSGHKSIVKKVDSQEEARKICNDENNKSSNPYWYEFSVDIEQTKN